MTTPLTPKHLTVAGQPVHFVERGPEDAPCALLLHSAGLSAAQWRPLLTALGGRLRLVAPDLSGYGDNPPWTPGAGAEATDLAIVAAFRDMLGASGQPLHLVGHSYGGWLALKSARQRPDGLRSLALFDPVAFGVLAPPRDGASAAPDPAALSLFAEVNRDGLFFDDQRGGTEAWLARFIDYWSGDGAWERLPPSQQARFVRTGRKSFEAVRDISRDLSPASAYGHIQAPTLLISGARSPAEARAVAEVLAGALPRAALRFVPGGHMAPLTDPGPTIALLGPFLTGDPL